ncbi:MAG: UDP-4-amino-4,6-dideoxy-N-acetyl-beta-L-altrosamine transaminase [Methylophilaceae bacterium]|nr:UDP-4-amino-4,6-dideoxy-N-acetyl-beta-L-altrosamine transaminase [Methylophilaceae bacterium]
MTLERIPYGKHYIDEDDIQSVVDVMRNAALTQGPKVKEFEQALAKFVGAKYAVAVSSGTAALHMACLAAELGEGDNVVTSPNTFVASANCAIYVGATPQFADIDPNTLNMSPDALTQECERLGKVSAIIPVHFGGLSCDMPAIQNIAKRNQAIVIEDASHALGATYPTGEKVGCCTYADMTVFSFHPVKIIAAGEGGMITTNDEDLYRKLIRIRSHGITKLDDQFECHDEALSEGEVNPWYYEMLELGFNYRITDMQSALALSQLNKLDSFLFRRRSLALAYDEALLGQAHIKPAQIGGRKHNAHHLYVVRIDFKAIGKPRRDVMNALIEQGVIPQVHYIPVHLQPFYKKLGYKRGDYPNAEAYYDQALSLPEYYSLTDEQQQRVLQVLLEVVA